MSVIKLKMLYLKKKTAALLPLVQPSSGDRKMRFIQWVVSWTGGSKEYGPKGVGSGSGRGFGQRIKTHAEMPENPGGAYFEKEAPLKAGDHRIERKIKSPFGRGEIQHNAFCRNGMKVQTANIPKNTGKKFTTSDPENMKSPGEIVVDEIPEGSRGPAAAAEVLVPRGGVAARQALSQKNECMLMFGHFSATKQQTFVRFIVVCGPVFFFFIDAGM